MNLSRYAQLMATRGGTLVIKFGVSLYIARFIGLEAMGVYGLIVALSQIAPMLLRAGMMNSIARELVDATPAIGARHLKHYLIWVLAVYILLLPLAWVPPLTQALTERGLQPWVVWLILLGEHLAIDAIVFLNSLRRVQAANLFGLLQSAVWVLPFCALGALAPAFNTTADLLLFWSVGNVLALLAVARQFRRFPIAQAAFDPRWYRDNLRAAGYLFLSELCSTAAQFVDRYIIVFFLGLELAGVYALFFQLANSVLTLINASVLQAHIPRLVAEFRAGRIEQAQRGHRKLRLEGLGLMAAVSVVISLAFGQITPLLNRPLVQDHLPLLWLVMLANLVKTSYFIDTLRLYADSRDRSAMFINLTCLILVTGLSCALAPTLGLYGIPLAGAVGYIVAALSARRASARPPVEPDRHAETA